MKASNQENLKALINLMRTLPEEELNMTYWTCGTAACVGGWVGRMPEFKAMGGTTDRNGMPNLLQHCPDGYYFYERGSAAVGMFLGIDKWAAEDLCHAKEEVLVSEGQQPFLKIKWCANPEILFDDVKPSDVVEILETWLEEEEI